MLGTASLMAFVATTDAARSRAFYEGVLGLELVAAEPRALVFSLQDAMLRVTILDQHTPPQYTVLGWKVDDIAATVTGLVGRGVAFEHFDGMPQDDLGICTFPGGDRVAWFTDPDGNMLSVSQLA